MNTRKFTSTLITAILFSLVVSFANAQSTKEMKEIRFTNFSITKGNNKISINWATDNAVETNYFEIQKSDDGINFKTVALVLGPDPKQTECDCYGCFDKYTPSKHLFYRLKHIDTDGTTQLSEIKQLAKI